MRHLLPVVCAPLENWANNLADAANLDGPSAARLRNEDIVGLCREATERAEVPAELPAGAAPSPAGWGGIR